MPQLHSFQEYVSGGRFLVQKPTSFALAETWRGYYSHDLAQEAVASDVAQALFFLYRAHRNVPKPHGYLVGADSSSGGGVVDRAHIDIRSWHKVSCE